MLSQSDSNNIVGTKDAAEIPVPLRGRAYARTGPRALVPFQCAWSGAPFTTEQQMRSVGVHPFGFLANAADDDTAETFAPTPDRSGHSNWRSGTGSSDQNGGGGEPVTQLEVLVDVCAEAARAMALPLVRRPWLEPLAEVLPLDDVIRRVPAQQLTQDPGRIALVGMYDDPENQAQQAAVVDLEVTGGLVVVGSGGSGKSTLLRSLAVGLARQGGANAVQIYALDFASRSLDQLADLPQCAGVIAGDEAERTTRLLTVLEEEIAQRRTALADARAENLGALRRQTGNPCFPRIVLLLDGYSGFHSTFDRTDRFRWITRFQQIVSAGRQVGVHVVLTNDRRLGIPAALLSAIGARMALRMSTPEELSQLGVPSKVAKDADLPNGRGFLHGSTEVQVACVGTDPSALGQSQAIGQVVERLRAVGTPQASQLPELPATVPATALAPTVAERLTAPLGLVDMSLATVTADLRRQNMVVLGPPQSGKSTAMVTIAQGLRATCGPDVQLCVLASATSPLRDLDVWDDAAFTHDDHAGVVERLAGMLVGDAGRDVRAVLFVDAAEDMEGNDVVKPLEALAKNDRVRMVVATEAPLLSKAYTGWLSHFRRNRTGVLLQPETKNDVETGLGIKPDLRPDQEFPPGRGIFVANRRWQLVQVAQPAPADRLHTEGTDPLRTAGHPWHASSPSTNLTNHVEQWRNINE